MKKKREYVGKGLKWFMDFLPNEVYSSLSEDELKSYREYRRYQRFIGESKLRVEKYQREMERLKRKISVEKDKVKGTSDNVGWEVKMKRYYDIVSSLDVNFVLNCSVEKRDRTSKSKKFKEGDIKFLPIDGIEKHTYKGENLTKRELMYGRVENSVFRVSIYLGVEKEVRKLVGEINDEDLMNDPYEDFKDEVKILLNQYSRYKIYKTNWKEFKSETHNIQSLKDWCEWCEQNGVNRYEWGGVKPNQLKNLPKINNND